VHNPTECQKIYAQRMHCAAVHYHLAYRDQLAGGSCSAVGHKGRGLRFDPGLHAKAAQRHARQEAAGRAGAQVRGIETLTDASMAMRRDLAHHHRLFDLICAERSA
jgi:hypothetical protein